MDLRTDGVTFTKVDAYTDGGVPAAPQRDAPNFLRDAPELLVV